MLLGDTRTDVQCLHRWNKVLRVSFFIPLTIDLPSLTTLLFITISSSRVCTRVLGPKRKIPLCLTW